MVTREKKLRTGPPAPEAIKVTMINTTKEKERIRAT